MPTTDTPTKPTVTPLLEALFQLIKEDKDTAFGLNRNPQRGYSDSSEESDFLKNPLLNYFEEGDLERAIASFELIQECNTLPEPANGFAKFVRDLEFLIQCNLMHGLVTREPAFSLKAGFFYRKLVDLDVCPINASKFSSKMSEEMLGRFNNHVHKLAEKKSEELHSED